MTTDGHLTVPLQADVRRYGGPDDGPAMREWLEDPGGWVDRQGRFRPGLTDEIVLHPGDYAAKVRTPGGDHLGLLAITGRDAAQIIGEGM